jgi:hypothetical protein
VRSACGDHAAVSARRTVGGCTQHVFGLVRPRPRRDGRLARATRSRAGPDADSFPRSRPGKAAGSSREGMSRSWRLGGGADAEVSSPAARGAGVRVSVTAMSRLVESPASPCLLMDKASALSLFPLPPSTPAAGCSFTRSHRFFSFEGLLVWSGRIGGPSRRLAARGTTPNAHFGLDGPLMTVRCHSG